MMNLDDRGRAAAKALHRSAARFQPRESLRPPRWPKQRRRQALVIPVALTLTVLVALAWVVVTYVPWQDSASQPRLVGPTATPPPSQPSSRVTASGSWRPIHAGPGGLWPSAMFWTGSEALVFAGADGRADHVTGGRYDPRTDRWRPINDGGLEWRAGEAVVWTGHAMIVWGGDSGRTITKHGGIYEPTTDQWRAIAEAPLPMQGLLEAAWTGREMVVLTPSGAGAAYDPASNRWRLIPSLPLKGRLRPAMVWTGSEVVVWGGCSSAVSQCDDAATGDDELKDGAAYDPTADRWRVIAASPLAARDRPQAVWTGREMIVWGGAVPKGAPGAYGAAYDPALRTWKPITTGPLSPRSNHTMTWTGKRVIVWGGVSAGAGDKFLSDGASYDPVTNAWKLMPKAPLSERDRQVAVWTGTETIIWGGCCQRDAFVADGAAFRPS